MAIIQFIHHFVFGGAMADHGQLLLKQVGDQFYRVLNFVIDKRALIFHLNNI